MSYDPNFIPGETISMPDLGVRAQSAALDGGTPIDHTRFSIIFNQERGFALCIAQNIDGATLIAEGVIDRHDRFRNDPRIAGNLQVDNDRGYRNNPWDRGHLVRRRSMHWGAQALAESTDQESYFWQGTVVYPSAYSIHNHFPGTGQVPLPQNYLQ